jgi:hypothetical protein
MANRQFKGRPKGSNRVIIEQDCLENFYIAQDEYSYNLIRRNANSETTVGYFVSLSQALQKAAGYVQLDGSKTTLEDYVNKLNNKLDEFKSSF